MGDMVATFGYGNLYMGYEYENVAPKYWTPSKAVRSADFMMDMACSLYGIIEAHEENGMVDKWFDRWQDRKPQYSLSKGASTADGNGLIYDRNKYDLLRTPYTKALPYARHMTRWNLRHESSGVAFWVFVYHLIAGEPEKRNAQMKVVLEESVFASRAIHLCDVNGYSTASPDDPVRQAMDAGLTDVYADLGAENVVNGHLPTHDGGEPGKNLDHVFTGPLAEGRSMTIVDPGNLSDHKWLKTGIYVPG